MPESHSLTSQLYGTSSHVHLLRGLEGLTAHEAGQRPHGAEHSIYQLVRHMVYWQDIALGRIRKENPPRPATASEGWPSAAAPAGAADWDEAVAQLGQGLAALEAVVERGSPGLDEVVEPALGRTVRDAVLMVLCHNSYHLGQVVLLRQALGAWPPPSGGDTW